MRSSLIAILFFAALCHAQQPDVTVDVKGIVTDSLTKAPLPRVHVELEMPVDEHRKYGAMTAADGSFSIKGVIAGAYSVWAEKAGFFIPTGFEDVETLPILPDKNNDLRLELAPDGWITGRVTNADGEPVEGVDLTADSATVESRGLATTDANGRFRIGGLAPGRYRVVAAPDNLHTPPEQRTDGTVDMQDAVTWFPDSLASRQAKYVNVAAGVEASGIDVRLVRVPIVSVSGRVEGIPPGTIAQIRTRREGGETLNKPIVRPDGTFRLWRLMPGKYEIEAIWQQPSGPRMGSAPQKFEIVQTSIENILLHPIPPVDVAGHLEYADDAAKPAGDAQQAILLTDTGLRAFEFAAPISAGSFAFTALPAGRYRVTLPATPGYVVSMQMGSQAIEGSLLDLSSGAAGPLMIRVSSATAKISGVVTDAKGPVPAAQVSLVFDGEQSGVFPQTVTAGPDGAYKFDKVMPAKYKLIALPRNAPVDINDYEDLMDSIEAHPNDKITKNLGLTPPQP